MDYLVPALVALLVGGIVDRLWSRKYAKLRADHIKSLSREVHEDTANGWLQKRVKDLEDVNFRLYETILEFKREGFELQTRPPSYAAPDNLKPLPGVVKDVIEGIANPGDPVYNALLREAENELEKPDADPEAIAQSIAKGSNYTPYE